MIDETFTASGSSPNPTPGQALPAEIGGYRILGFLGQGGMGVVYEAQQPEARMRGIQEKAEAKSSGT